MSIKHLASTAPATRNSSSEPLLALISTRDSSCPGEQAMKTANCAPGGPGWSRPPGKTWPPGQATRCTSSCMRVLHHGHCRTPPKIRAFKVHWKISGRHLGWKTLSSNQAGKFLPSCSDGHLQVMSVSHQNRCSHCLRHSPPMPAFSAVSRSGSPPSQTTP